MQRPKQNFQQVKQGNRTFNNYLAEFETWSPRTGWTLPDLFDRLKAGLNSEYITWLSYFQPPATTYTGIVTRCKAIDISIMDMKNANALASGKAQLTTTVNSRTNAFRNPNAMDIDANLVDIDATNIDKAFVGLTGKNEIRAMHRKVMKDRCKCCGSKNHRFSEEKHLAGNDICSHCGKKGHWYRVCMNRIMGKPKITRVAATGTSSSSGSTTSSSTPSSSSTTTVASSSDDRNAEIARLRDMV